MSDLALFLAGDALINQPWSRVQDPAFERLVAEMRAADATVVNLETVIHEFKGYAQADSGGAYTASPPAIARELKWAGVDMLAHANNHAFDYGSAGILETLEHVEAAGLLLAGSGRDLQQAREPRVLTRDDVVQVTPRVAGSLRRIARLRGKPAERWQGSCLRLFGRRFQVGETNGRVSGRRPAAADAAANLAAIAEAARQADLSIASIHAHLQGRWLSRFARDALAAGADIVFCHGAHDVGGIEIADGKPIFHGLGDFVFEVEAITRHPAEAYERAGLGDEASVADLRRASRVSMLTGTRHAYQGCAAALRLRGGRVAEIRLLPLDLQFDAPAESRGRPRWADPELGREIIERIAARSKRFGTQIHFDAQRNQGSVAIP